MPIRHWRDLAWTDLGHLAPHAVALLPVAAIEQHGPHLPLDVDAAIVEGIVARALALAPAELPLLVLPAQHIGFSLEHARFPGTLTLRAETVLALWTEIGAAVARAGLRKLVLFNGHGGQPQLVDIACRRLRAEHRMLAVGASWYDLAGALAATESLPEIERRLGIHGGAIETAMMLHLAPARVRREAIAAFPSRWGEAGRGLVQLAAHERVGFGWETQDLNPAGAVGDPRLATPELGRALVEDSARALLRLLVEVDGFDAESWLRDAPQSPVA